MGRHLEIERIRVRSQFFDETLLQSGHRSFVVQSRIDLFVCQIEILAERQAEHVEIFATVSEGGQNVAEDFAIFNVFGIDENDTVCFEGLCWR